MQMCRQSSINQIHGRHRRMVHTVHHTKIGLDKKYIGPLKTIQRKHDSPETVTDKFKPK